MKPRFVKIGTIAEYAINGRPKQLRELEPKLKEAGYDGVISNESTRALSSLKLQGVKIKPFEWLVLYFNTETKEKLYAYRSAPTNSAHTKIVSIKEMERILNQKI